MKNSKELHIICHNNDGMINTDVFTSNGIRGQFKKKSVLLSASWKLSTRSLSQLKSNDGIVAFRENWMSKPYRCGRLIGFYDDAIDGRSVLILDELNVTSVGHQEIVEHYGEKRYFE